MQEKDLPGLLKRYQEGQCTDQEKAMLESWYLQLAEEGTPPSPALVERAFLDVKASLSVRPRQSRILFRRLGSAAAIILISAAAFYFYQGQQLPVADRVQPVVKNVQQPADAMPGSNRAILTLSDGSAINLDDAQKGEVAIQGNTGIEKTGSGELVYISDQKQEKAVQILYNTVSTPRGGQYQITLPDGTRVWLNAASTLRFPTRFTGAIRQVKLSGEAYFEVSENKENPFIVELDGSQVQVLGTHFNIMAYSDEVLTTTLLEGSVSFKHAGKERTIVPGQAAQLLGNIRVSQVNTADAIAWKNGITSFTNMDIHGIMRQISRWYDLDVVYGEGLPTRKFTGKIPRTARLSKVLRVLELSDINFKLEDKRIIVTP